MRNAVPPQQRVRRRTQCSTARDTPVALNSRELAATLRYAPESQKQKARSPFGASGLFGEGRGIYTTLSEILGRKLNAGS